MRPMRGDMGGHEIGMRFGIGQCALGALLVAATDVGIATISLGDDAEHLLQQFQDRFPAATPINANGKFNGWMARAIDAVEQPELALRLPLDVQGTAFQKTVWQALRAIPFGHTATYADVARALGKSSATRAVANGCGANPVAVAIPCHRVVRTDGGLGGYRWGIHRKQALLACETRRMHGFREKQM